MIYATEDSAGRLAADALHLAISLDSFTTLDWVERIGPAVQHATLTFADLERRHALLAMRRADDPVIDWVLDTIDVRLNFLHHLSNQCGSTPSAQEHEQNHRLFRPMALPLDEELTPRAKRRASSRSRRFPAEPAAI